MLKFYNILKEIQKVVIQSDTDVDIDLEFKVEGNENINEIEIIL